MAEGFSVLHSALRGMLRDAEIDGYRVPDLSTLFASKRVKRLDKFLAEDRSLL